MKILSIFAHPDEGEIYTGGISALFARAGHAVKFLSLTNGDAGHFEMTPSDLAKRRYGEAMQAREVLGLAEYEVLDYHDQHLENTETVRAAVQERIRRWEADIVMSFYPVKGGHPDNMCAGWIVRDAVQTLPRQRPPLVLYIRDYHTIHLSAIPDIALAIDAVWETKLRACSCHGSQVHESLPHFLGILDQCRRDPRKLEKVVYDNTYEFSRVTADIRLSLDKWYPPGRVPLIRYAEAFEIAEFGMQPTNEDVRNMIPFADGMAADGIRPPDHPIAGTGRRECRDA